MQDKASSDNQIDRSTLYQHKIQDNNDPRFHCVNWIAPDSVVLDVGCACGDFGAALDKSQNIEIFGLEYDKAAIDIAKNTNAYKEVFQVDLDIFDQKEFDLFYEKFDYIVLSDVLEHLRNPLEVLKKLKKYLKPKGSFLLSIPNIAHASIKSNLLVNDFTYTPLGLLDETHLRFFTYQSIAQMLAKLGLQIDNNYFSFASLEGFQPHNPYPKLPFAVKKLISTDWHSYVCQYVMQVSFCEKSEEELLSANSKTLSINESTAPEIMKNYRRKTILHNYPFLKFCMRALNVVKKLCKGKK